MDMTTKEFPTKLVKIIGTITLMTFPLMYVAMLSIASFTPVGY